MVLSYDAYAETLENKVKMSESSRKMLQEMDRRFREMEKRLGLKQRGDPGFDAEEELNKLKEKGARVQA